jgi:hypothetical protein
MVDCFSYMDGFRTNVRMMKELACSEKVWEETIVVETPYSVGPGGFKEIECLYSSGESEISTLVGSLEEVLVEYNED